jgi:hypothetical protein
MTNSTEIISRFAHYPDADAAVTKLTAAGFSLRNLGIIGDEHRGAFRAAGPTRSGDRLKQWTMRAAFAGGTFALVAGAIFGPLSIAGSVFVLGYFVAIAIYIAEGGVMAGAFGLVAAAAANAIERKSGVVPYERVLRAENFLLVSRGTREQNDLAKALVAAGRQ